MAQKTRARTSLEVARLVLADLLERLGHAGEAVREGEPDGIHDMRTTLGRLRALLAAFRPVLDASVTDEFRERLAEVAHSLEPARTIEVRRLRAESLLADEARAAYPADVRQRLVVDLAADEQAARADVVALLDTDDYQDLLDDLGDLISRPPLGARYAAPPAETMRAVLRQQAKRTAKRLKRVDVDDLRSIHDARKAARRFRHTAEALTQSPARVFGAKWMVLAELAHDLQDAAGDHRDARLYVEFLQGVIAETVVAGHDATWFGMLAGAEAEYADDLLDDFAMQRTRFIAAARAL